MLRLKLNLLASLCCWVRLNELEIVAVWIIVALVADENSLDCANYNVQFSNWNLIGVLVGWWMCRKLVTSQTWIIAQMICQIQNCDDSLIHSDSVLLDSLVCVHLLKNNVHAMCSVCTKYFEKWCDLFYTRWFAQHNVRGLVLQDYSFTVAVAQYFDLNVHTADFRIHCLKISQNV